MKICLVSRRFNACSGSAEWIYSEWLSKQLRKKGFEILEISQKGNKSEKRYKKIIYDLVILPIMLLYARFFLKYRKFYFLSENQGLFSPLLRLFNSKCYIESYDIMRTKNKKFSLDRLFFQLVYGLLRFNSRIICISTSTKKDLIKEYSVPARKIELIYPVSRQFYKVIQKKKKKKKVIGYLGSLGGRKRTSFFKKLEEEIRSRKIKNLEIHIWGKGEKGELSNNEIVKLKGYAPEEELLKIYNGFDYFVFPSEYEGLGLPIIEASMCGKPSFILKDAYFPEEVREISFIVKNSSEVLNTIIEMPPNSKEYKLKSDFILKKSGKFSLENNLNKLIGLIR